MTQLTAEARERIQAAQKARWTKIKAKAAADRSETELEHPDSRHLDGKVLEARKAQSSEGKSATVADFKDKLKLELLVSFPAPVEKKLERHRKNLDAYMRGMANGKKQFFGYKFLTGRELLLAKETIPHGNEVEDGGFLKWLTQTWPDLAERTAQRLMQFATDLIEKSATVADFKDKPLQLSAGKLTKKEQEEIVKLVPEVMDGKGMVEFMRDMKLLKEPQEPGGFRPDVEKLEAWLKEKHADLCGKSWEELPKAVQDEFIADDVMKGPRLTPEALDKQVEQERSSFAQSLIKMTSGKWVLRLSPEQREDLKAGLQAAIDRLNKLS